MAALTEPARSVTSRGEYLWETMSVLWPPPARVERSGRATGPRPSRAGRDREQTEYLVLPNEARAVLLGWGLQMAHFALVAPKGEDGNLWAVGLFVQAFFAAVALGLAVLAYVVANRLRSRTRT